MPAKTETPTSVVEPTAPSDPRVDPMTRSLHQDERFPIHLGQGESHLPSSKQASEQGDLKIEDVTESTKDGRYAAPSEESVAGKQFEVEPLPTVITPVDGGEPQKSQADARGAEVEDVDTLSDQLDRQTAEFPSVPESIPNASAAEQLNPSALRQPGEDTSSGASTPIDARFVKAFPSVPEDDEAADGHHGQLGSPEGKVRVQVHVPTTPSRTTAGTAGSPFPQGRTA